MPTPLGHSLAGYALARFTRVRLTRDDRTLFAFAALFGILPDLLGRVLAGVAGMESHGFAHSCAAMVLVAALTALVAVRFGFRFWPVLLLVAAAYGSHLLADLLRPATEPNDAEQLFWPLPGAYGIAINILPHIPDRGEFPTAAAFARAIGGILLRETLVLGPLAILAYFVPPRIPARATPRRERAAGPDGAAPLSADTATRGRGDTATG